MADSFKSNLFLETFKRVLATDAEGNLRMALNATVEVIVFLLSFFSLRSLLRLYIP